jgi:hypothetical protein
MRNLRIQLYDPHIFGENNTPYWVSVDGEEPIHSVWWHELNGTYGSAIRGPITTDKRVVFSKDQTGPILVERPSRG